MTRIAFSASTTDWTQIVALNEVLLHHDSPIVALNHAVAVAMFRGPHAGLELLATLGSDPRVSADRRFHAVRAHLQETSADRRGALESYEAGFRFRYRPGPGAGRSAPVAPVARRPRIPAATNMATWYRPR